MSVPAAFEKVRVDVIEQPGPETLMGSNWIQCPHSHIQTTPKTWATHLQEAIFCEDEAHLGKVAATAHHSPVL